MKTDMTTKQRGVMIGSIISQMQLMANGDKDKKPFSDGGTFFALAFKSDSELCEVARLCGVL